MTVECVIKKRKEDIVKNMNNEQLKKKREKDIVQH